MAKLSKRRIEEELKSAVLTSKEGNPAKALRMIAEILRVEPKLGAAHLNQGIVLLSMGGSEKQALASFLQALKYEPNNSDALEWACQVSLNLRMPKETEQLAKRLIRLQPSNDRALFVLSIAMSLTGRWLDALEAIDGALKIQPASMDYIVGRAQLLRKLHLNRLSIEAFKNALEIQSTPQIARELAEVLMEEGFVLDAINLLKLHLSELPTEEMPNLLLARAYTESQQFEEALPYWDIAERLAPDRVEFISERARSEISAGRLHVAEGLLRKGLEDSPLEARFFALLAPIRKMAASDAPLVERMDNLLDSGELSAWTLHTLNFALGKSYDDFAEYGRATRYYDEANRLRTELSPNNLQFDRESWKADIDFQISFFTKERVFTLSQEGFQSDVPLFVMGMIRSGTTLTEQVLSCHSQIASGGENTFWGDHQWEFIDRPKGRFDLQTANRLGRQYVAMLRSHQNQSKHVIDKNPLNILIAAALHCALPQAKMIHIRRNPVDNLLSIWMTPMLMGLQFISSREDLVYAYGEYLRLADHLEGVLPADRFATFHYEDLTSNPDRTIRQMFEFLNLEPEAACLAPEKNKRTVRTPSAFQVRQPINTESQEKWKRYEPWLGSFKSLL